jgi:hypothetical protein
VVLPSPVDDEVEVAQRLDVFMEEVVDGDRCCYITVNNSCS